MYHKCMTYTLNPTTYSNIMNEKQICSNFMVLANDQQVLISVLHFLFWAIFFSLIFNRLIFTSFPLCFFRLIGSKKRKSNEYNVEISFHFLSPNSSSSSSCYSTLQWFKRDLFPNCNKSFFSLIIFTVIISYFEKLTNYKYRKC